jgi:hypothetical protein
MLVSEYSVYMCGPAGIASPKAHFPDAVLIPSNASVADPRRTGHRHDDAAYTGICA